jgi:CheY-like chemotaxis protein
MKTILVVEDEECIRDVLRQMLEQADCRVLEAGDAETALRLAEEESPDLVLMDYILPGLDGHQALQELHSSNPGLPVIFITGLAKEQFWTHSLSAKAFGVLLKPFSRSQLLATVHTALKASPEREIAATA